MIFIEDIVRDLLPEVHLDEPVSLLCLNSTNPTYLVFMGDAGSPRLVVHLSEAKSAFRTHEILREVHSYASDVVPEPIAFAELEGRYVSIQSGLEGKPWFQIAKAFAAPAAWKLIKSRSLNTLEQLQRAVMLNPKWQLVCDPGRELRICYEWYRSHQTAVTKSLSDQVDFYADKLDQLGEFPAFPQHGDFTLNNLIIGSTQVRVIDFEDFGITNVPLYDEFSLALSFFDSCPKGYKTSVRNEIEFFTKRKRKMLGFDDVLAAGLYLHHLLVRLGDWSYSRNRTEYRILLEEKLNVFLSNPESIFDA